MNKFLYVGKKIQLYPGDEDYKEGIIEDVDDLGWVIKITKVINRTSFRCGYVAGDTIFISISTPFKFKYLDDTDETE